jgi:hypothetical protein
MRPLYTSSHTSRNNNSVELDRRYTANTTFEVNFRDLRASVP